MRPLLARRSVEFRAVFGWHFASRAISSKVSFLPPELASSLKIKSSMSATSILTLFTSLTPE